MVREEQHEGKRIYLCEVCGLGYLQEETAMECQEFCSKNNACSLEITRKAIYKPRLQAS